MIPRNPVLIFNNIGECPPEVKRDIIAEIASRRYDFSWILLTLGDQIAVPDIDVVGVGKSVVTRTHAIPEYILQIVEMNHPKDGLL